MAPPPPETAAPDTDEEGGAELRRAVASFAGFFNTYTVAGIILLAIGFLLAADTYLIGVTVYAFTKSVATATLWANETRLLFPVFYIFDAAVLYEGIRRYKPNTEVARRIIGDIEIEVQHKGIIAQLTAALLKKKTAKRLRRWIEDRTREDLIIAGDTSSTIVAGKAVVLFLAASAAAIIAGIPILVFLPLQLKPAVIALAALPISALYLPSVDAKSKKQTAKDGIQDELPFFVALATIMSSAGLSLYQAMRTVAAYPLFKFFGHEARIVTRDVQFFAKSPEQAMDDRALIHPNEAYSKFITGYTAMSLSGGDTTAYLYERSREQLNWVQYRWRHFAQNVSMVGEMSLMVFLVVPAIMVILSALAGPFVITLLPFLTVLFALVMYMQVSSARPKYLDKIHTNPAPPILAGAAAGAVIYVTRLPLYIDVAIALLLIGSLLTVQTARQFRAIAEVEEALPQFLRDVTEYRKVGIDVAKAMEYLTEKKYPPAFAKTLKDYVHQIKLGLSFDEATPKTTSWLGQFAFYVIRTLVRMGEAPPRLLEQLTEFVYGVNQAKREAKSEIGMYKILTFMSPVILSFVTIMVISMLKNFAAPSTPTAATPGIGGLGGIGGLSIISNLHLTNSTIQQIDAFIVFTGFVMGLVTSKAIYGSIFNMQIALITTAVSVVAIVATGAILPLISSSLSGSTSTVFATLHIPPIFKALTQFP